jgi:hypothetical protein
MFTRVVTWRGQRPVNRDLFQVHAIDFGRNPKVVLAGITILTEGYYAPTGRLTKIGFLWPLKRMLTRYPTWPVPTGANRR